MGNTIENFVALKKIAKTLVRTPFQQSWQWKIEFSGRNLDASHPKDFDFYIKDISYAPYELETGEVKTGVTKLSFVDAVAPVEISMTLRDNDQQVVYAWIEKQIRKSFHHDGTVALPSEYWIKIERYALPDDGTKKEKFPAEPWEGFFTQLGEIEESRDEPGFLEFPATFLQFRS